MNVNDPNVAMLELVSDYLGDALRAELVFVGGAVAGLLITDQAMPEIRPTQDVDVVCSSGSGASWKTSHLVHHSAAGESKTWLST